MVVFALVASLGAHWALLQTVAWTTMLASNLQSGSFSDAMTKTFDGRHPCPLCRAIAAAKKSEQKNQSTVPTQKLEFPPLERWVVLPAPGRPEFFPSAEVFAELLPQKPPTPPPRSCLV